MNTLKNKKEMWAWSAMCLVALGLTAGTGCDRTPNFLQGTESQTAIEAATSPSAAMARLFNPVIEARLEPVKLVETIKVIRLESADSVGITLLR